MLLVQCGIGIRRKNFSLRGDLVHINERLIIYACFVFELEKNIMMLKIWEIYFYASQEVFFCSVFYLQDMA